MGAPLRTTHADLDAVTRLTSAERTELSDIGLPPSLLIALANLIGCDVVLIAETAPEQLDHSFGPQGTLVHQSAASGPHRELTMGIPSDGTSGNPGNLVQLFFVRARTSEFSDRDRSALSALRPHLRHANLDSELRRQNLEQRLTARQQEILTLVAEGCTNAQIASRLSISAGTVRKHLENAYRILGVSNRIGAISARTDAQALPVSRTRAS